MTNFGRKSLWQWFQIANSFIHMVCKSMRCVIREKNKNKKKQKERRWILSKWFICERLLKYQILSDLIVLFLFHLLPFYKQNRVSFCFLIFCFLLLFSFLIFHFISFFFLQQVLAHLDEFVYVAIKLLANIAQWKY